MHASSAPAVSSRRRRKWPLRVLLALLILLAALAGGWFLGVRPYLNNLAKTQINQALDDAQSQILLFQLALPPGPHTIPVTENQINNYLSGHASAPLQNLSMTITPSGLRLDFTVYGFNSAIMAVPIANHGSLEVTNVQVQGPLGLIMSSDELTTLLNNSFHNFGQQMHREVDAITLHNRTMDIKIR